MVIYNNESKSWAGCCDDNSINDHDYNSAYIMIPFWVNIIMVLNICFHNTGPH